MTLIADFDLDLRKDLYSLSWTIKKSGCDEELLAQGSEERYLRVSKRKAIAAG
ncbi:hypothetical protein [Hymenobacter cellulosivorans]|uniref:Uncharacterized protein n=1 Tax=Hymenobacter cellulosivorans TaxID=2932249 RepID=A0ABY4F8L6_9BACT|nr:hypothetical protein [Hymenobacter cellulosivorans]UOQ52775.1 hypothetical protein MUN80_23910 [Hymenobacter cellulosivorans]